VKTRIALEKGRIAIEGWPRHNLTRFHHHPGWFWVEKVMK